MKNWLSIPLPTEFTNLLHTPYKSSKDIREALSKTLRTSSGFQSLFRRTFRKVDSNGNLENIFSGLGWNSIRNQLGAGYWKYLSTGSWADEITESEIERFSESEKGLSHIAVSGSSRIFLLNFYFLMSHEKLLRTYNLESNEIKNYQVFIPQELLDFLKRKNQKIEKPDLLIFYLIHFQNFGLWSPGDTIKFEEYGDLLKKLSDSQNVLLHQNLLNYLFSINENDFFQKEI